MDIKINFLEAKRKILSHKRKQRTNINNKRPKEIKKIKTSSREGVGEEATGRILWKAVGIKTENAGWMEEASRTVLFYLPNMSF